jgi:hypothetical protein
LEPYGHANILVEFIAEQLKNRVSQGTPPQRT